MQASLLYQVTLGRRHRLTLAMSSVGVLLTFFMLGYLFQRQQPNKLDQLLGSVPHAHVVAVGVDGLSW